MQMTNGEIIANYRQAKNKKEQLKILAELNACTQDEIKKILLEGGLDVRQLPRTREKTEKVTEKNKAAYIPPMVEISCADGNMPPEKELPSNIILQALQCFRADIENRMAKEEEEHAARMRSYMKRLEQIDEIVGGMA